MIRWTPTAPATPSKRRQSREQILKAHLGSLTHNELLQVRPNYYGWVALKDDLARKAGFDPNQPRVPANNPGGGQWTSTGGVQVTTSDGFLTGISTIDDTSRR